MLVADEMITGFGRTGKMWGIEHSGVEADIVTVGKGMGSGFPVSGVLMSDELRRGEPFAKPSASSSSYGGNPLAAVAVAETLARSTAKEAGRELAQVVGAMHARQADAARGEIRIHRRRARARACSSDIDLVRDLQDQASCSRRKVSETDFLRGAQARAPDDGVFPARADQSAPGDHREQAEAGVEILDEVFAHVRDHRRLARRRLKRRLCEVIRKVIR